MFPRTRVLILCTENSARSQMARGLWQLLGEEEFDVLSAGLRPTAVRPEAVAAMRELGIDIASYRSRSLEEVADQQFDIVLTVCDSARESCPTFPGAAEQLHWSVDDPTAVEGSEEERRDAFRRVRDELRRRIATELALRERV